MHNISTVTAHDVDNRIAVSKQDTDMVLLLHLVFKGYNVDLNYTIYTQRRVQPDQCYFTVQITGSNFECSL